MYFVVTAVFLTSLSVFPHVYIQDIAHAPPSLETGWNAIMHVETPTLGFLPALFASLRWVSLGLGTQGTSTKKLVMAKKEEEGKVKDSSLPPQLFALLTQAHFFIFHSWRTEKSLCNAWSSAPCNRSIRPPVQVLFSIIEQEWAGSLKLMLIFFLGAYRSLNWRLLRILHIP